MLPRTLPFRGVTNATPFRGQPEGFAPFGHLLNFLPHTPGEDRARGGQRPGTEKLVASRFGSGRVQAMEPLTLASSVTGYTVDDTTCENLISGNNYDGAVVTGNAWMFTAAPGMFRQFSLPGVNYDSGVQSVNAACWDPDGEHAYCLRNYIDSGPVGQTSIYKINRDGTTAWSVEMSGLLAHGLANTVETDGTFVFVTDQHTIQVHRCDTGAKVKQYTLNGWANEVIDARIRPDGKLVACFRGSGSAGTVFDGSTDIAILAAYASDFRSGVALYDVSSDPDDTDPLTWRTFGPQLSSGDQWFETTGGNTTPHGYFRFSESLPGRPRGRPPTAIAVGPDNSVVVVTRNKGFGPNADYPPDDTVPFITAVKLDEDGNLLWAVDTDSKRDSHTMGSDTFYTDRWATIPSIQAVAVADDGNVYVAGDSHTRAGANVFRLSAFTGAVISRVDLGDATPGNAIQQAAMDIQPLAGLVGVAGVRNNVWPDASSAYAHVWYLSPGELEVVRQFDIIDASGGVNSGAIRFNAVDEAIVGTGLVT